MSEHALADRIMKASHAGEAKRISKELPDDKDNIEYKIKTMRHLIHLKAQQHSIFRETLLDSKEHIAEATRDLFWGCGLKSNLAKITAPSYWPGTNMLGKILMEVRQKLQAQRINTTRSQLQQPKQPTGLDKELSTPKQPTSEDPEDGEVFDTPESATEEKERIDVSDAELLTIAPPTSQMAKKVRGRPPKKSKAHPRHFSLGDSPRRSGSRTRTLTSLWDLTREKTPKRKETASTPPKAPENKSAKQGEG